MKYRYNGKLNSRSREMRKNMTKEERKLWFDFLSNLSIRIYRQKIIGNYIIDFYCAKKKIAIEIDGSQHYEAETIEYDRARTEYLKDNGITVLRYGNLDINQHFESVCADIMNRLCLND